MIPKSGYRFSEKIMLKDEMERDDDSKKSHHALSASGEPQKEHPDVASRHPG
jgi:DNA-binding winged helix-turn-helix (wHTH) protein